MNTMKKAHEIRKAASEKWNCKVSEICFSFCLKMAHNGEELEMIEEIVINVIPEDYNGDPKKTLGYCWSDYANKTPGIDVTKENWRAETLKEIKRNNAKRAYVNCMWSGGYVGEYPKVEKVTKETKKIAAKKETHGTGWCNRCDSYCFGDCQANF